MPVRLFNSKRRALAGLLAAVFLQAALAEPPPGRAAPNRPDDTAGIGGRTGKRPVHLDPTETHDTSGRPVWPRTLSREEVELGRWAYRVEKHPEPRDAVPWLLHARPIGPDAATYRPSGQYAPDRHVLEVPVIRVPDNLWPRWLPADMRDVVGIHYHEFVTKDLARVLITIHKIPPDGPDGFPPEDYSGVRGSRLEATLMTPVTYMLDQSIVIRSAALQAGLDTTAGSGLRTVKEHDVQDRIGHEQEHGLRSLAVMIDALAGPQSWNLYDCTGQRAALHWYWRTEKIGRRWDGFRDGRGEVLALRTKITLAPPTRWSKLLPKPPEQLTEDDLRQFNDEVVHPEARFVALDRAVQEEFHSIGGAYEPGRSR